MKVLVFIGLLLSSMTAFAGPKIKQIDTANDRVAVTATKQTTMGSEWIATSKKGQQCTLEVTDKLGNMAILDASGCDIVSKLKVGQRLEKSVFQSSAQRVSSRSKAPAWFAKLKGFSVFGFYSLANDVDLKVSDGRSGDADVDRAVGFGAEYAYNMSKVTQGLDFDLIGGLTYDLSRDIDGSPASFSLWTPYVNARYNFTQYVSALAGLNYSIPLEDDLGEKLKSDVGYQIGMVGNVSDNFAVDGLYRWINMKSKTFKEAKLDGFMLRGRYIF